LDLTLFLLALWEANCEALLGEPQFSIGHAKINTNIEIFLKLGGELRTAALRVWNSD
jgi:hypothetical protein